MRLYSVLLILILSVSCTDGLRNQQPNAATKPADKPLSLIRFDKPVGGSLFTAGDAVEVKIAYTDTIKPDSVVLFQNRIRWKQLQENDFTIYTDKNRPGSLQLNAVAWKNGQRQTASATIRLKSNVAPTEFGYRIVKSYPHDKEAYTQGLFYHDGFLYEGTGRQGSSSLRKVELESGKVLQSINISYDYFGEGITLLNGKIYQLTWTTGIGFVYDTKTFKNLNTFGYSTQGWGLTTNGTELVMSDGSNTLYFMEPNGFSEVRRVEVYDNNGPVKMLNELELINGKIYANIYLTNRIAIINPENGIVEGIADLTGILKPSDTYGGEDVLNGIAYDSQNNRIFVTGKLWSKLYWIELKKK